MDALGLQGRFMDGLMVGAGRFLSDQVLYYDRFGDSLKFDEGKLMDGLGRGSE